jgi:hypothetical protein
MGVTLIGPGSVGRGTATRLAPDDARAVGARDASLVRPCGRRTARSPVP